MEVWTPEDQFAKIERERVLWKPRGVDDEFALVLAELLKPNRSPRDRTKPAVVSIVSLLRNRPMEAEGSRPSETEKPIDQAG